MATGVITMIVNNMLENFKEDIRKTIHELYDNVEYEIDPKDRKQLFVLYDLLVTNEYVVKAMTDDFDIENAPNKVYLFDTSRNMFWKGSHGYTRDIYSAALFSLEGAVIIADKDIDKTTKIIYF